MRCPLSNGGDRRKGLASGRPRNTLVKPARIFSNFSHTPILFPQQETSSTGNPISLSQPHFHDTSGAHTAPFPRAPMDHRRRLAGHARRPESGHPHFLTFKPPKSEESHIARTKTPYLPPHEYKASCAQNNHSPSLFSPSPKANVHESRLTSTPSLFRLCHDPPPIYHAPGRRVAKSELEEYGGSPPQSRGDGGTEWLLAGYLALLRFILHPIRPTCSRFRGWGKSGTTTGQVVGVRDWSVRGSRDGIQCRVVHFLRC